MVCRAHGKVIKNDAAFRHRFQNSYPVDVVLEGGAVVDVYVVKLYVVEVLDVHVGIELESDDILPDGSFDRVGEGPAEKVLSCVVGAGAEVRNIYSIDNEFDIGDSENVLGDASRDKPVILEGAGSGCAVCFKVEVELVIGVQVQVVITKERDVIVVVREGERACARRREGLREGEIVLVLVSLENVITRAGENVPELRRFLAQLGRVSASGVLALDAPAEIGVPTQLAASRVRHGDLRRRVLHHPITIAHVADAPVREQ